MATVVRQARPARLARLGPKGHDLLSGNPGQFSQRLPVAGVCALPPRANVNRIQIRDAKCGRHSGCAHASETRLNLFLIDLFGEPNRLLGRGPRGVPAGAEATHNSLPFCDC